MLERISRSWELVLASAEVLRSDKELMIFPAISMLGILMVTAAFALPLFMTGYFQQDRLGMTGYLILFAFYLVENFVVIYANSALVGAALIRLRGGDPTVSDGLRIANDRIGSILGYAAISATIGLVLSWFSERGSLGNMASSIMGLAWGLATFLVVPVLVSENLSPWSSIQRSTYLLKKTWGDQIVGNFSIGLIFGLFILAAIIAGVVAVYLVSSVGSYMLTSALILALVLLLSILGLLSSTLSGIFSAAVYNYAATGSTGGLFRDDLIRGAFQSKRGMIKGNI